MSRYLTPLPGLFAGLVDTVLNQAIRRDPDGPGRLEALAGRRIKFELEGLGLELHFRVQDQRLQVRAEDDGLSQPDTVISGSPGALLAMSIPDWRSPGGGVSMQGSAETARYFEQLLRRLRPDWEAALVEQFGEVLGHQLFRFFREAGQTGRQMARTGEEQLGEYLREESELAVSRPQFGVFSREVDELREAVDRLESRLRREGRS